MIFIAEFCQNHNGDFELLKEMVHAAKENGADYAKIQTIFADMVSFRERFEKGKIVNGIEEVIKRPYKNEFNRLKELEISYDEQSQFVELCHKVGIKPLTTVFTRDSINLIKDVGFDEIKVASYDCGSKPLINDIKNAFNKIFVSTGASFNLEIEETAKILDGVDFSLLHCVTQYPTPLNQYNLSRMNYLRKFCSSVGWSDHSLVSQDGINGSLASIFYDAAVLERHFTILPSSKTKDGPVSINPNHLSELKKFSNLSKEKMESKLREVFPLFHLTLGTEQRDLSNIEIKNRDYFRGRFINKVSDKTFYNWEDINFEL
jgi:N,N'-diacetyllegionaminate synthase